MIPSLIIVAYVPNRNSRPLKYLWVAFPKGEVLRTELNSAGSALITEGGWPTIDLPSSVAPWADELTKEPLDADLSLRLPWICAIRVKGRYEGARPRIDFKIRVDIL